MKSTSIFHLSLALAASLLASACSRELPSQWPETSPASVAAEELPPAAVTLALDEDPPLPGEPADGWHGLEQPRTSGGREHHGHHGHHGHQQSDAGNEPMKEEQHVH